MEDFKEEIASRVIEILQEDDEQESEEMNVQQGKIFEVGKQENAEKVFDSDLKKQKSDNSKKVISVENQNGRDRFYESNWRHLFREEDRRFSFQTHWTGLSEEQTDLSHKELLNEGDARMVSNLRLELGSAVGFGFMAFEDEDEIIIEDRSEVITAAKQKQPNERIRGIWREQFPAMWLDFGKKKPLVFRPGRSGATKHTWGKVFNLDNGTWSPGVVHKNATELIFDGDEMDGRAMITFVPIPGGGKAWMLSFPENQEPIAEQMTLERKIKQLKDSSNEHNSLIWNNPTDDQDPELINIDRFNLSDSEVEEISVEQINALWS